MKKILLALALFIPAITWGAAPVANLTWDSYATSDITLFGITGYQVQRSIQPIGTSCTNLLTYTTLSTIGISTTATSDPAQALGKTQCYVVEGLNAIGASPMSNAAGKDFPLTVSPAVTNLIVK